MMKRLMTLAIAASSTLALATVTPASASVASTGTIKGTLSSTSGPFAGACVTAFDVNGTGYDGAAPTSASGAYKITGLPAGAYALQYYQCQGTGAASDYYYVPGYYRHVHGLYRNGATPINVSAGRTAIANDSLVLGGALAVHAQYPDGTPISGAIVCPNFTGFQNQNGFCGFTDGSGSVTLIGVPTGANKIGVYDFTTGAQYFYGDTPAFWASPAVSVSQLATAGPFTVTLPAPSAGSSAAAHPAPRGGTQVRPAAPRS